MVFIVWNINNSYYYEHEETVRGRFIMLKHEANFDWTEKSSFQLYYWCFWPELIYNFQDNKHVFFLLVLFFYVTNGHFFTLIELQTNFFRFYLKIRPTILNRSYFMELCYNLATCNWWEFSWLLAVSERRRCRNILFTFEPKRWKIIFIIMEL